MKQIDDASVIAELHAAIVEDMADARSPRRNWKRHIVLAVAGALVAVVVATAGWYWYRSNHWASEGVGPAIDEMQWTGQQRLDFSVARTAVDQYLIGQGFEEVPTAETPAKAQELAQGLSIKKAPLNEQTWYCSPTQRGEPFYVVTFAHSSSTEWEDIRAEYLGFFVVWDYSGFRWNVDANEKRAESFLQEARQWWEETQNQWER